MAAPASGHRSVAGRGAGVLGTPRQTQLGPLCPNRPLGRVRKGARKWEADPHRVNVKKKKNLNSDRNRGDYSLIYSLLLTGKNSDPEKLNNLCEGSQRVHGRADSRTQAVALNHFFALL